MSHTLGAIGTFIALLGTGACRDRTSTAPVSTGAPFTTAPVTPAAIDYINPLGHMTTPFNALPQGRIYLVLRDRTQPNPIMAPASGTVSWILGPKPDYRVEVRVNDSLAFFVDHVVPEPAVMLGARVGAGQRIATHSGATCCVDFGVLNDSLRLTGYVRRARYSPQVLLADAPLKYFAEPLRSQLYAMVVRFASDRDGKHDYDVAGRLAGNWFLDGTPDGGSLLPENWPRQLAFAYSNTHPQMVLVSVAGTLALTNLFAVHDGAPDPATVSVASGLVVYRLVAKSPPVSEGNVKGTTQLGVMLVQVLDDSRIRVEILPGATATGAGGFTTAAQVYTR